MELIDLFEELKKIFEALNNKLEAQDKLIQGLKLEKQQTGRELRLTETQRDEALRKLSKFKKLMGDIDG